MWLKPMPSGAAPSQTLQGGDKELGQREEAAEPQGPGPDATEMGASSSLLSGAPSFYSGLPPRTPPPPSRPRPGAEHNGDTTLRGRGVRGTEAEMRGTKAEVAVGAHRVMEICPPAQGRIFNQGLREEEGVRPRC